MPDVLIVDESIRMLLHHLNKIEGCFVREARDGMTAMRIIEKGPSPDLVILDFMMPGMEVCRKIRRNPTLDAIYIIMLSARTESSRKVNGFDMGVDDYVTKPFGSAELLARVDRGLRTSEEERQAIIDPLTGLYNRRSFTLAMQQEMLEAERYGYTLTMLMADLDHFKKVNDTWGHDAGDEVLTSISKLLKRGCRGSDIIARRGGEEFAILLPRTELEGGLKLAEDLRNALSQESFGQTENMTASFGVSSYLISGKSLMNHADMALYRAKGNGRNRVEAFEEDMLL